MRAQEVWTLADQQPFVKAPFSYQGGKGRAAHRVWELFGDPATYVEPFFGSGAVLLGRESPPRHEIVNDLDANLSNFWRAVKHDPVGLAKIASYPVDELTLAARHKWLYDGVPALIAALATDPEAYDLARAAWWVWGISQWLGSGWLTEKGSRQKQLPRIASRNGIHCHSEEEMTVLLTALQKRLSRVHIANGDWKRVLGDSIIGKPCCVFLDPPYAEGEFTYSVVSDGKDTGKNVTKDVFDWAIENQGRRNLMIAVCGYEGTMKFPDTWYEYAWSATGGLSNLGTTGNRYRERIWFSPSCGRPISGGLELD